MPNPWELTQQEIEAASIAVVEPLARLGITQVTEALADAVNQAIARAAQKKLVEWLQAVGLEQQNSIEIHNKDWQSLCKSLGVQP
jgi:hypothetical protein